MKNMKEGIDEELNEKQKQIERLNRDINDKNKEMEELK